MNQPLLSAHFASRKPSDIRLAQEKFAARRIKPQAVINVSIGNVSLPMNPAMQKRMFGLDAPESPFSGGSLRYTETAGTTECREAFKNILRCEGFATEKLLVQVTDGSSAAMELLLLGVCGPAGTEQKPLLLIDPAYTNYLSLATRIGRHTVAVKRCLDQDGRFALPRLDRIEEVIQESRPGALVVVPYDNPTGQLYDRDTMVALARICVKYNMWLVSDEAYRELYYDEATDLVSIWGITDADAPGIEGRRIGLETSSKVWNACGLRIGAMITDNAAFHDGAVAEYTANLCANAIGQYIFGALAHQSKEQIAAWCKHCRDYYRQQIMMVYNGLKQEEPGLIVSSPDAAIYSVVDVKNVVKPGFDATEFVLYCAEQGSVMIDGVDTTLLVSPMAGFYDHQATADHPWKSQFRIAYVETPQNLAKIPALFVQLLRQYEAQRD